jgi:hypothetical protein
VVLRSSATRRHDMSTTPRRLINLYCQPRFQREDGLRRGRCDDAGATSATATRIARDLTLSRRNTGDAVRASVAA